MYGRTKSSLSKEDILSYVRSEDIAAFYFGITEIPCLINSPLRKDNNPSFAFFTYNDNIIYKDFATGDSGDVFKALCCLWCKDIGDTLNNIYSDIKDKKIINTVFAEKTSKARTVVRHVGKTHLDVAIRD